MLEEQTKVIGSTEYTIRQMPGRRSMSFIQDLFKTFSPALTQLIRQLGDDEQIEIGNLGMQGVCDGIVQLAADLPDGKLEAIMGTMGEFTRIRPAGAGAEFRILDGATQDAHFAGKVGEIFAWLSFALQVNYADFFGDTGSLAAVGSALRAGKSNPSGESRSPSSSTGSSGDSSAPTDTPPH